MKKNYLLIFATLVALFVACISCKKEENKNELEDTSWSYCEDWDIEGIKHATRFRWQFTKDKATWTREDFINGSFNENGEYYTSTGMYILNGKTVDVTLPEPYGKKQLLIRYDLLIDNENGINYKKDY